MANIDWSMMVTAEAKAAQAAAAKHAAINAEREHRIAAGATVTVTGAGAIPVQGREVDVRNLQGLGLAALARVSAGDTTTVTTFRDAANVDHELTPPQVLELVQGAASAAQAIIQASWAIKAMDPLPEDVRLMSSGQVRTGYLRKPLLHIW